MFDIGWTEILVIVAVAVIVVGPKDIPKMLKTVGKYLKKARAMMRDVRRQVEDVADISEIKELKETAAQMKKDMGVDSFDDPMKMGETAKTTPEPAKAEMVEGTSTTKVSKKPKAKPKAKAKTTKKAPAKKAAPKKTTAKKPAKKAAKKAS